LTINGVPWSLTHDDLSGWCDNHERQLWIEKRLRGKALLGIIIHEVLHAQNPDFSEERIEERTTELTEMVWRFCHARGDKGFRVAS
jgi:hypothetical protein